MNARVLTIHKQTCDHLIISLMVPTSPPDKTKELKLFLSASIPSMDSVVHLGMTSISPMMSRSHPDKHVLNQSFGASMPFPMSASHLWCQHFIHGTSEENRRNIRVRKSSGMEGKEH